MSTRFSEHYEFDARSSEEVVKRYRRSLDDDGNVENEDDNISLALVHYRGGLEEFYIGQHSACSADPQDRVTGADVLAQLGWGDQTFQEESVDVLLTLLLDADVRVVEAALHALGHRKSERSFPFILPFAKHTHKTIRLAVAHSLGGNHAT